MVVRARDRARRQGGDGRARARLVPEDLRRDRAAHPRADQARARVSRRCGDSRRRWREEVERRIGDQDGRDDDLAGRRPARRLRRLRPERARPDDRLGVLDPPDARRARLGAAALGRGAALSTRRASRSTTMREADREGRRPDRRDVAAQGRPRSRASSSSAWRRRSRDRRAARQQPLAAVGQRPALASRLSTVGSPRLRRGRTSRHVQSLAVLVGAEAEEARPVAEAVALHLVVAHLDDELRPHRGSSRALPRAPAALAAGDAPVAQVLRLEQLRQLRLELVAVTAAGDRSSARRSRARRRRRRGRAAASRSAVAPCRFQRTPTITQSAVLYAFTLTTPSREPGR